MTLLPFLANPAIIRAVVAIAALAIAFSFGYSKGSTAVTEDWQNEKAAVAEALQNERERQQAAGDAVVADYEKRLKAATGTTITITKKVPVYVPSTSCPMPPGFRVLHNAAASGVIPNPSVSFDGAGTAP